MELDKRYAQFKEKDIGKFYSFELRGKAILGGEALYVGNLAGIPILVSSRDDKLSCEENDPHFMNLIKMGYPSFHRLNARIAEPIDSKKCSNLLKIIEKKFE